VKHTDKNATDAPVVTTYHEQQIGKTLYRVTSIYKGEIELKKALEDLTVRKILRAHTGEAGERSEGRPASFAKQSEREENEKNGG